MQIGNRENKIYKNSLYILLFSVKLKNKFY